MLENLLLDAEAIWRVLVPYTGNLLLKSQEDVTRTLRAIATGQMESEIRLRVARHLPVAHIRPSALDRATAMSTVESECQKQKAALDAIDFEAVVREARQAVETIVSDESELERFHGKNIIDAWLREQDICDRTGLSRNAFLTQLAQEAARSARTQRLTSEAIDKIRLYFPGGLEALLDGVSPDEQALIEECQSARRRWEEGKPESVGREALRSRLTASSRAKQQSEEEGTRRAGQELMRRACSIGAGG
jgi:3-hydroxyacyl-CoA dehydrogenase